MTARKPADNPAELDLGETLTPEPRTAESGSPSSTEPTEPTEENLSAVDPFDPALFAVDETAEALAAPKLLVTCRVDKPSKTAFVRASARPEDTLAAYVLKLEEERETYLVMAEAALALAGMDLVSKVNLTVAIDRQGNPFLWVTNPPGEDGRDWDAWRAMRIALEESKKRWVRVQYNTRTRTYDVYTMAGSTKDPEWPEHSLADYLRAGFGERVIRKPDHPIVRRLLGQE